MAAVEKRRVRGAGGAPRRGPGRVLVAGRSMLPTLRPDDQLLVWWGARPRPGRLVVVRLPDGVVAVKRATRRDGAGWWVERDNPAEGVDSWAVGAISDPDVLAVVVWRYWSPRWPHRAVS